MRGIDTNVLVRYLAQDDAAQSEAVDALVKKAVAERRPLHVDDIVLCETVWVLRAAYGRDKASIVNVLEKILETSQFSFDDRDLLTRALADFRDGKGDFADYVIGRRNRRAGCDLTVTFDRSLRGSSTFSVL